MAYSSFSELLRDADEKGSIAAAVLERESLETEVSPEEIRARMATTLEVMRDAMRDGKRGDLASRSGLTGGDAAKLAGVAPQDSLVGGFFTSTLASALATAEVNAAMGRIVAAPTGGASGVLPAVLVVTGLKVGADDDTLVDGLLTAAGIGSIIAAKATLSGAVGGCQAEIGSGAAMGAAAAVFLLGGSAAQSGHAASLALQGQMGLVCDPVGGLVEIPCVVRNATGAAVALAATEMAMAGIAFPIPLDEVIEAMGSVGRSLPPSLRETALGGLAVTPTAKRLCDCAE